MLGCGASSGRNSLMSAPRQDRRSDPVLESPGELSTGHVDGSELELLNDVEYPDSDGVPMSETDFQFRALHNARHYLLTHFHGRPDVYVSGNILVYYVRGNPKLSVSPDILVALGVPRGDRRTYKTWLEGKAPDFVMDVPAPSTSTRDLAEKRDVYASLGIHEYFLFDASEGRMHPPLQGYTLKGERYERMPDSGQLAVRSPLLGLDLWVDEQRHLRMRNPRTGVNLPSSEESELGRQEEIARSTAAIAAAARERDRADRERERAVRNEEKAVKAEAEAARERVRADREQGRCLELAARVAELQARLGLEP